MPPISLTSAIPVRQRALQRRGVLLLVTVDGRQRRSQGVSLPELAAIMKRLGAVNALNFDGGGSSTLVVQGGVANAPSDGRARPIADGLLVYAPNEERPEDNSAPAPVLSDDPVWVRAGDEVRLPLPAPATQETGALWATRDGFGFVSQTGVFLLVSER